LRELESEPIYPHGPARGSQRISKHFGMPTQFIKDTWAKPAPATVLLFLCLALQATAGDITRGTSFADGQRVSAAQLHQLVDSATINNTFYTGKAIDSTPLDSDYLLVYSPALLGFYKMTLGTAFLFNTNLITEQTEKLYPAAGDFLLLYDASGAALKKINWNLIETNLFYFLNVNSNASQFFQAGYSNAPFTNLPPLTTPILNDDQFWIEHDTNAAGSHTNFSGYALTAAGYITNSTTISVFSFPATNTPQTNAGSLLLSTNCVVNIFAPASTNYSISYTNIGMTNYAVTNVSISTNSQIGSMTLGGLFQLLDLARPRSEKFTSGEFDLALSGYCSTNHGLGGAPQVCRWVLVCKTNDASYIVGNEVSATCFYDSSSGAPAGFGASATNVFLSVPSSHQTIVGTNGSGQSLTLVRWKAKAYAEYWP